MSLAFTGVYVFGDSLVDAGNALELAETYDSLPFASLPDGAPTAEQGYYRGRFSDGFTFADLISIKAIGVPTRPVFPFGFDDPFLGITYPFASDPDYNNPNFAYGGAQIRRGSESVPDLDDQTDAFRDAVDGDADPAALHLFTIGANDVRELVPATGAIASLSTAQAVLQSAASELIEEVRQVIETGARHVIVTGIPDIGTVPYYNGLVDEIARRAAASDYSLMLDSMIRARLGQLPTAGVEFRYIGFMAATQDIIGNLVTAGLYDPAVPLNRSGLFFDRVHPTAQAHALLAASMLDTMNGSFAGETASGPSADFAVPGTIGVAGEVDKLVVSLAAETTYSFAMLGISSGKPAEVASWQVLADPAMRLLGPGGQVIAADDDGGLGLDAHLEITTTQAGDYTLELAGVGNLSGTYRLRADNETVRNDIYHVNSSSTLVIEGPGGGTDRIFASVNYTLAAGSSIETLSTSNDQAVTTITLTGNELAQTLIGDSGDNVLAGQGGDDTLIGGVGADALIGGAGNDTYFVDAADLVVEAPDQGYDTVAAGFPYRLAAGVHVELMTTGWIAGIAAINLAGNEFDNQIWGNDGSNVLDGGGGNDALIGFGGNDTLIGGAGADVLFGGGGADALHGGTGDDTIFLEDGTDSVFEAADEGHDTVAAGFSYTLASGVHVELMTTGWIAGTASIDLTGNELGNELWGNSTGNVLNGGGGNDALVGFGGNDTLIGGAGVDVLIGGPGNDVYFVDAGDVVVEVADEGHDTVAAGFSYRLAGGVQVELMTTGWIAGTAAIDLAGNEVGNQIWGNDGSNVLDGGGGSDALFGFGGADTFSFTTDLGAGNVDLIGDFQAGIDRIALSYEKFAGLGVGEDAITLRGSAFHAGSAAHDADDRIIYDPATGALWHDSDGSGGAQAVQFATLIGALPLSAADFLILNPAGGGYWDY